MAGVGKGRRREFGRCNQLKSRTQTSSTAPLFQKQDKIVYKENVVLIASFCSSFLTVVTFVIANPSDGEFFV